MQVEQAIAFATEQEQSGLEIRVNFGVFAGRDATTAELEELGQLLLPEAGEVSIVGEERHELSDGTEAVLHQVRVAVPTDAVPVNWDERRADNITDEEWSEIEGGIARSHGTCMTMGTASTMTAIAEAMGMTLPGASSIPAPDANHVRMSAESGEPLEPEMEEALGRLEAGEDPEAAMAGLDESSGGADDFDDEF